MKAIKKTVSILIVVTMIFGMFTMIPFTASATEGETVYENITVYQWYEATRPAMIVENNVSINDPNYIAIDRNNLYDNLIIVRCNKNVSFSRWDNTWDYVLSQTEDLTVTPYNAGDNDTLRLKWYSDNYTKMGGDWYDYGNVTDELASEYVYVHAADFDGNKFLTYDDNGIEEECRWGYYTWRSGLTLTYHPYNDPTCQANGNQEYYSDQYGNCYNPELRIDTENHTLRAYKFSEDDTIIWSGGYEHQFDDPTFTWTATDFDTEPTVELSQSTCAVCGISSDWQVDNIECYEQTDPDENTCGQKRWSAYAYEQNTYNSAGCEYLVCCGATGHTYSTEPQWSYNTVTFACTDGGNDAQFDASYMGYYAVPATAESCISNVDKYAIFFNGAEYTHEVKNVSSFDAIAMIRRWDGGYKYYYYASLREALDAAQDGDTVTLQYNSTLQSDYTLDKKHITLDLNGKKVDAEGSSELLIGDNKSALPTLTIVDNSNEQDGSFTAPLFMSNGKLTLESGRIGSIIGSYGTVVIDGGTVDGSIAMIHDQSRKVQINGGKFRTLPTADYVTYNGVISEYSDDYYTVGNELEVAEITGDGHCTLPFATLALAADTVRSGETISVVYDIDDAGLVKFDGVKNVTLEATGFTVEKFSIGLYDADVTITGGTFIGYSGNEMIWGVKNKTPDESTKSTLTIKGGSFFSGAKEGVTITGNTHAQYITVNIEGGSFESTNESATSAIHVNSNNAETNKFVVSGGRFKQTFNRSFLAGDYSLTTGTCEGYYMVMKYGRSIALHDSIVTRFYFLPAAGTDIADYSVAYTYNGDTVNNAVIAEAANGMYSVEIARSYAAEINAESAVTVSYNNEVIVEDSYSIVDYCNAAINGNYSDEVRNVCQAVLCYGASAQDYFDGSTEIEHAAYYNGEIPENFALAMDGTYSTATIGFSLVTNAATEINFYVSPNGEDSLDDLSVAITDDSDNDVSYSKELLDNTNRLRFKISGIKASELNKQYTITVTSTKTNQTRSLTCSALSYAYKHQNNTDYPKLATLLKQLYNYYLTADEYVRSVTINVA